jgi:hypothetical protein
MITRKSEREERTTCASETAQTVEVETGKWLELACSRVSRVRVATIPHSGKLYSVGRARNLEVRLLGSDINALSTLERLYCSRRSSYYKQYSTPRTDNMASTDTKIQYAQSQLLQCAKPTS